MNVDGVWTPSIPNPPDIAAEPDDIKAARLLACLRDFANDDGVTLGGIEIDGVKIMLVKYDPARHLFELEPDVDA